MVRIEPCAKRVRAYAGGELVVDTSSARFVWEHQYYPAYYVPEADVRVELVAAGRTERSDERGDAEMLDIKTAAGMKHEGAYRYPESPVEELRKLVHVRWRSMDEWLEEDELVYVHPRSPYTRVDILNSSRHVEIAVDGVTVADSHRPAILFETGLPPRYYLPLSDVRMELLHPSETETMCPYKGTATYWSLEVNGRTYPDFVWTYRAPLPESQKVAGLVCFYNEKVDLVIDGQAADRPSTIFT